MNPNDIILAFLSGMLGPAQRETLVFQHKELVKSEIGRKQPKPGKGRPAKGYDPETKTWRK